MNRNRPETPEEQWQALVSCGEPTEAFEPAPLTEEEVAAKLRALGYNLKKVEEDGENFVASLLRWRDEEEAAAAAVDAEAPKGGERKAR